jgi:hypothetical protein
MDGTESLDRRQWQQRSNRSTNKSNNTLKRPVDLMATPVTTTTLPFPNNVSMEIAASYTRSNKTLPVLLI